MASLVTNLLQFTRRNHRQVSTIDVREEITNSIEFVSYYLRNRKIEAVREFADSSQPIHADRQQLRQLFLNMVTNACDAMPAGGTLTVRANRDRDGAVVIEFGDTGHGIAPHDLENIWEPFFYDQAGRQRYRTGPGHLSPHCRRTRRDDRYSKSGGTRHHGAHCSACDQ